jgi:hypothetical protein
VRIAPGAGRWYVRRVDGPTEGYSARLAGHARNAPVVLTGAFCHGMTGRRPHPITAESPACGPPPAAYAVSVVGSGSAGGTSAASMRSASRLVSAAVCSSTSRSALSAQLVRYGDAVGAGVHGDGLTAGPRDGFGDQLTLGVGELWGVAVLGDERVRELVDPGHHTGVRLQALTDDDRLRVRVAAAVRWSGVAAAKRVSELGAERGQAR